MRTECALTIRRYTMRYTIAIAANCRKSVRCMHRKHIAHEGLPGCIHQFPQPPPLWLCWHSATIRPTLSPIRPYAVTVFFACESSLVAPFLTLLFAILDHLFAIISFVCTGDGCFFIDFPRRVSHFLCNCTLASSSSLNRSAWNYLSWFYSSGCSTRYR